MNRAILSLAVLTPAMVWGQVEAQRTTTSSPGPIGGAAGLASLPRGQAGPVVGKPLTATEVYRSTQVLADGTRVDLNDASRFYRDDQGRMRTESKGSVVIFDPVAGFVYFPRAEYKTYRQSPIGNASGWTWVAATGSVTSVTSAGAKQAPGDPAALVAQRRFGLPASAPVTETLAPQTVNGILANGTRVIITIPKGALGNDRDIKVVNERWYSDDLKVLVKSTNTDPRYGVTTYDLTQVALGPPNPALFQVPGDYELQGSR